MTLVKYNRVFGYKKLKSTLFKSKLCLLIDFLANVAKSDAY